MKPRDFQVGWRQLARQPGTSGITVLGLALAYAACYLLIGFASWCMQYNSHVPQAGQVYVVKQRINHFPRADWNTRAMLMLRDVAEQSGVVEQVSIMVPINTPLRAGEQLHDVNLQVAEASLAPILGITPLAGDLTAALTRPDGIALTREASARLFGQQVALGQTVRLGPELLQVLAVLPDVPANATLRWDALTGPLSRARPENERMVRAREQARGAVVMRLRAGANVSALEARMQQALDDSPMERKMRGASPLAALGIPGTEARLVALPDAYFDPDLAASRDKRNYGQRTTTLALAAVALLILALAISNWINLALVRSLQRQREIAMRKVLGASAIRVASLFMAESVLVALVAGVAGIVLAWLLLPLFTDLVGRPLSGLFSAERLLMGLLGSIWMGVLAGLYPACSALRVRPALVLAGRDRHSETPYHRWSRRGLAVLQFATAMGLAAATVAVLWQTRHASHADPGFDPHALMLLHMPRTTPEQVRGFTEAVRHLPGIEGSAVSAEAVGRDLNQITGQFRTVQGQDLQLEIKRVSPDFFDLYRIKPLAGRLFSAERDLPDAPVVLLNQAAVEALGFAKARDVVGKMPFAASEGRPPLQVVGVVPLLRQHSMHRAQGPMIYQASDGDSVVTVRTLLDQQQLTPLIAPLWQRYFPDTLMYMQSAESIFAESYAEDERLARMLGLASIVALALAAFGIYVLSSHSVARSQREIVMRKLHGASNGAIARRLGREFGATLLLAALLGLPLAALGIAHYLAGFAERAPLAHWPLVAGFALAALTCLAATWRHVHRALRLRPVQALRD